MEKEGWFSNPGNRTAVAIINPRLSITDIGLCDSIGFRWVKIENIRVYACYKSPNTDFDAFEDISISLERSIRNEEAPVVVAGDFNANSPKWDDYQMDRKGRGIVD